MSERFIIEHYQKGHFGSGSENEKIHLFVNNNSR